MKSPASAATPANHPDRSSTLSETGAVSQARDAAPILRRLRHLKVLRAKCRRHNEPHAFKLTAATEALLLELYPGVTPGEAKALFPLKTTGRGSGLRYWVVPKLIDRWFDEHSTNKKATAATVAHQRRKSLEAQS